MNNIFILDGQTDEVLGHINKKYVIDNEHEKDLPSHKDYFRFTVLADNKHAEHLTKRNGLIIPGEDGELLEFRIFESIKYRNNEGLFIEVHALATYLDLKTQKIFDPQKTTSETALQHATTALDGTEWQVGNVEFKGVRTLDFDSPFNSYDYILRIAREFELEPRFYIETDGQKVIGRYVDLIERIGEFRGRTVEFGRDLQRIERKEDTSEVVTALWVYGPQREDGTRLKVLVEDDEARQRWGRRGQHIIDYYEPQTENQDITEERLKTLGEIELKKRINAVVTYEAEILDLENVPGLENKKIRFGDTIRIKDTKFNPPLYLEARVFNVKRDVFNKANKTVQLGDYVEYTEEEINAIWRQLQNEIRRRLDRLAIVSINSTAGNVFKNAQGETELTARTFVNGAERDEDGTLYDYQWMRFDKNGNHDTSFYAEGKTITVTANDIDEKATYRVLVAYELEVINTAEITISNVFDGEDGEPGPPGQKGEDGQGVEDITVEYYLSDSDSTQIGGTWTETKPSYQPGKYLWIRQKITYKNPTVIEYTTPVLDDSWKAIEIADEAKQEAEEAKQEAQNAMSTADGKNTVFRQSSTPPTTNRKIGDLWFKTDEGNKMFVWTGGAWTETKLDHQALSVGKLSAISADLGTVTAGHIQGVTMNLGNGQFVVDSGNVKFAGHLEGATGSFTGDIEGATITGSSFFLQQGSGIFSITPLGVEGENSRTFLGVTREGKYSITWEEGPDQLPLPQILLSEDRFDVGAVKRPNILKIRPSAIMFEHNNGTTFNDFFTFDIDDARFTGTISSKGNLVDSIVEQGSNANGNYIRYDNGIQICWHNQSFTSNASGNLSYEWTLPASFINTQYYANATVISSGYHNTGFTLQRTTTMAHLRGSGVLGNTNYTATLFAIGRWK